MSTVSKLLILASSLVTKLQAVYKREETTQRKFLNRSNELSEKVEEFKKMKSLLN